MIHKLEKILALIPARGGSKGIPRKNVKLLAGKPLISWTINTALQSPSLAAVLVSTDDGEIAAVSRQYGAEVPFLRPAEFASDTATSLSVALHALDWLAQHQELQPEFVLLLQPTSPLRTADDIEKAIALQREKDAEAIVSLAPVVHPPHWLRCLGPSDELLPWLTEGSPVRRQEARPLYQLNGAIYLVKTSILLKAKTFFPEKTFGFVMPEERSLDIDTPWGFHLADLVLQNRHGSTPP